MTNFNYPFAPNTDLRHDAPNRQYIERTLAEEAAEPLATENAELDESQGTNIPSMPPTPREPGQ